MTLVAYIAERLPWAVMGLLIGYLMGQAVRSLDLIVDAVNPEEPVVTEPVKRSWWDRLTHNRVIGLVVFVLAVGSVVQGYVSTEATQRNQECISAYADGFADALDVRTKANTEWQEALDSLMTTVGRLTSSADPNAGAQFRAALAEYLTKRAEAKQQQQANPYPPPPRDVCK